MEARVFIVRELRQRSTPKNDNNTTYVYIFKTRRTLIILRVRRFPSNGYNTTVFEIFDNTTHTHTYSLHRTSCSKLRLPKVVVGIYEFRNQF